MKYLFTLCLLIVSLSGISQWQQTGSKVRYVNGLGIPTRDTAAGVLADSSQILIRPADSSLYVKYKRTWLRVGGGGGSIAGGGTTNYIPKFTSSTAIGNSQIFDNGTNVGIGTTSPDARLRVAGAANSTQAIFGNIDGRGLLIATALNAGTNEASSILNARGAGAGQFLFQTDGNDRVVINSAGLVGIGTTSPGYKLDLRNDVPASTSLEPISFGLYNNNDGGSAIYFRNSVNGQSKIAFGVESTGAGTNDTYLGFSTGVDASLNERMRITSSGNVGIGYTSPAAKLSVNGRTLINTNTDNGVDALQVSGSMNVSARATAQNLSVTTNATVGADVIINGNVGIGTSQIGGLYQLKVNSGIESTSSGFPISFKSISNINYNDFKANNTTTFGAIGNFSGLISSGSPGDQRDSILTLRGETSMVFATSGANERVRITASGRILAATTTDNGTDRLQVSGSIQGTGFNQAYLARTTTYTATTNDYFIDCTSGTFTVNLFTAVGNTGRILIIKNSGTGTITVDPNGSQTIDGATTQSLSTQWSRVHIISDGANWKIISN